MTHPESFLRYVSSPQDNIGIINLIQILRRQMSICIFVRFHTIPAHSHSHSMGKMGDNADSREDL
jgi:hypothetical protein